MDLNDKVIESLNTAIASCGEDMIVERVNAAFEDLFAVSRRRVIGSSVSEVVFADNKIVTIVRRAFNNQSRYSLREVELTRPHGLEVDVTITPYIAGGKQKVLIELNRMDRLNRLIRESNGTDIQETNRLMMRSLSHEVKNPLAGIRGAAQLLETELETDQKEFTQVIIKETDRLTNLVSRVMGSHKRFDMEEVNIHYIVEHVSRLLGSAAEDGSLEIKKDYDPSLPEFMGDDEQMMQAVLNIANNAIESQASKRKATIGFRTRLERGFTIKKVFYRQVIKLQIWDEGPGVPEEIKDIVFNPMITGRPEGTGLGLSISQEVVQRHDGLITLEEYQGKTCFSIYLPLVSASQKQQEAIS